MGLIRRKPQDTTGAEPGIGLCPLREALDLRADAVMETLKALHEAIEQGTFRQAEELRQRLAQDLSPLVQVERLLADGKAEQTPAGASTLLPTSPNTLTHHISVSLLAHLHHGVIDHDNLPLTGQG